jgi:hypothetical protein
VALNPGVKMYPAPKVDYSPLTIKHIQHPTDFHNVKRVSMKDTLAQAYGRWIRDTVVANTPAGSNEPILVIVHKTMLTQNAALGVGDDKANREWWKGRNVRLLAWGPAGIGSNAWRDCKTVFAFGEFFPRGTDTVGKRHAWSEDALTMDVLAYATARKQAGKDDYAPSGPYQGVYEGHLLRAMFQLAMRGSARCVDEQGRCGEMTLYTSMSLKRLLTNLEVLFPGANKPLPLVDQSDHAKSLAKRKEKTGRRTELIRHLSADSKVTLVSSEEVQKLTGIRSSDLRRECESPRIKDAMWRHGWELVTAREAGKPGKALYLRKCKAENGEQRYGFREETPEVAAPQAIE